MSTIKYFDKMRTSTIGPAPCEKCQKTTECELDEKACLVFWQYVEYNRFSENASRLPNKEIYIKIFEENEGQASLL
jgi:hypothetical protein